MDILDKSLGSRGDADIFIRALDDPASADGLGIRRLRRRNQRLGCCAGVAEAGHEKDDGNNADDGDIKRGSVKHGGSLSGR